MFFDTDPSFQYGITSLIKDKGALKKLHKAFELAGEAYWECLDHNSIYLQMDHINNFDGEGLAQVKDKVLAVVKKASDYSLLRHFQDKAAYARSPEEGAIWVGAMEA